MRSVLKPLAGEALTFWHVAGDLIWRGASPAGTPRPQPISRDDAVALRALYGTESRAAYHAGDVNASRVAASLWVQVTRALDAHDDWLRVCGRPAGVR